MRALGIRFLDREGRELMGNGSDLEHLAEIDDSGLDKMCIRDRYSGNDNFWKRIQRPLSAAEILRAFRNAHGSYHRNGNRDQQSYPERLDPGILCSGAV